jgi:hypothetical protein
MVTRGRSNKERSLFVEPTVDEATVRGCRPVKLTYSELYEDVTVNSFGKAGHYGAV